MSDIFALSHGLGIVGTNSGTVCLSLEEVRTINVIADAACDHACLIISIFVGVAGCANLLLSLFFLIYGCKKESRIKEMMFYMRCNDEYVESIRKRYPPGSRIMMEHMGYDPCPVEYGEMGTILGVDDIGTIHVSWDCGRLLGVIPGEDSFRVVGDAGRAKEDVCR